MCLQVMQVVALGSGPLVLEGVSHDGLSRQTTACAIKYLKVSPSAGRPQSVGWGREALPVTGATSLGTPRCGGIHPRMTAQRAHVAGLPLVTYDSYRIRLALPKGS